MHTYNFNSTRLFGLIVLFLDKHDSYSQLNPVKLCPANQLLLYYYRDQPVSSQLCCVSRRERCVWYLRLTRSHVKTLLWSANIHLSMIYHSLFSSHFHTLLFQFYCGALVVCLGGVGVFEVCFHPTSKNQTASVSDPLAQCLIFFYFYLLFLLELINLSRIYVNDY